MIKSIIPPLLMMVMLTSLAHSSRAIESHQILHQVSVEDGSVIATWLGENVRDITGRKHMPLTYGVQKLVFTFTASGNIIAFKPEGELFFDSWSFGIFSKNDKHVVLLQDHYGPYHVVKLKGLQNYLLGKSPPFEIVEGNTKEDTIALVHDPLQWLSDDTFTFSVACCGRKRMITHRIGSETIRGKWSSIHK